LLYVMYVLALKHFNLHKNFKLCIILPTIENFVKVRKLLGENGFVFTV